MSTADLRKRLVEIDAAILEQKLVLDSLQRDKTACLPTLKRLREENVPFIPSTPLVPLVLLGVCRVWRDIALAAPVLWTTVAIPSNIVEAGAFVDRWLGRAALLPLSIIYHAFDVRPRSSPSPAGCHPPVRPQDRVSRAQFQPVRNIGAGAGLCGASLLQRATFGIPEYCTRGSMDAAKILGHAPLRAVVLLKEARFSHFTLPCLQLTKFEGEIDSLGIFRMAPNLIEVKHHRGHRFGIAYRFLQALSTTIANAVHKCGLLYLWEWSECFSCIANTLENLEVVWALPLFVDRILHLGSPASGYHPLPHLQSPCLRALNGRDPQRPGPFPSQQVPFGARLSSQVPILPINCPHGTFLNDEFVSTSETPAETLRSADLAALWMRVGSLHPVWDLFNASQPPFDLKFGQLRHQNTPKLPFSSSKPSPLEAF
ncbi:hypothetical protein B0H14DRAFT_3701149 [Mycena olivaceomarginata]|nr:hypothetical protein B0H14DRAFT_3701149 [Mycena olivaceomarginata]